MGTDWQPFRLKPGASKIEALILEQRRAFFKYEKGMATPCPLLPLVELGHADELPAYADSFRLRSIVENPVFPKSWANELFTTCFVDEAEQLVQKRMDWIVNLREGRLPNFLKLRYLEQTDADLNTTWNELCRCVSTVRNRSNGWTRKEKVLRICEQIESLPSPQRVQDSFFNPYWEMLKTVPGGDPKVPESIDTLVRQRDDMAQESMRLCRRWNQTVKAEKCWCCAKSFDSFQNNMHDPRLDEFFEWTKKWINRGYGMYLSF